MVHHVSAARPRDSHLPLLDSHLPLLAHFVCIQVPASENLDPNTEQEVRGGCSCQGRLLFVITLFIH